MTQLTTHDQLHILNSILPHLLLHGKFTVGGVHLNAVVRPSKIVNGIENIQECENIRLKNENDYTAISRYLTDNLFTHYVKENDLDDYPYLLLTVKGEYLAACVTLSAYERVHQRPISVEETIERANLVIANISPYGEFHIAPPPRPKPTNNVFTMDLFSSDDGSQLEKLNNLMLQNKADYTAMVFSEYDNLSKDEKVLQYLINEGFVRNRHDIKSNDVIYRELTEKGRVLKELGSIAQYQNHEKEEQDSKRHQKRRDISLFWVVLFGALGTCISALFDGFQLFDYYEKHRVNWQLVAYFSSGFGLGLLVWILVWLLKKTISRYKQ